ncbi:MAG: TonB family protein [Bacteriovoracaceae bacterium]|nr:TonB family protein [Bacteriovoracaceae bacterium]
MSFLNPSLIQSLLFHFSLVIGFLVLVNLPKNVPETKLIKFKVIDKPIMQEKKIEVGISSASMKERAKEKVKPQKKVNKVFGTSRKSLTSSKKSAPVVKRGNTITKEVDKKVLSKDDLDELPIPKAEYLVTEMPSIISEVRITYPKKAKDIKLEGTVTLSVLIDEFGVVRDATLVEGLIPEMDEEALRAIKGYRFSPAKIEDKAVPVRIRYAINFVLEES